MKAKFVYESLGEKWGKFWGSDFEKLKATDKAIRTMSKEDQNYVDQNHANKRQDIGAIDNLVDTYNRVYGTEMYLTFNSDGALIIDDVWPNSVSNVRRKILKPLGYQMEEYDPGEMWMTFDSGIY